MIAPTLRETQQQAKREASFPFIQVLLSKRIVKRPNGGLQLRRAISIRLKE